MSNEVPVAERSEMDAHERAEHPNEQSAFDATERLRRSKERLFDREHSPD